MSNQNIVQRLASEKDNLTTELQSALQAVVFQHGATLETKMNKLVVKDDYGTDNYEKFFTECNYFIKTVMIRDIPLPIWNFFFFDSDSDSDTSFKVFNDHFILYLNRPDKTSALQVKIVRPINEIVQQAEMLVEEMSFYTRVTQPEKISLDPLFDSAVEVVLKQQKASISLIHRILKVDYIRAAKFLEEMEVMGIVSSAGSSGQRSILTAFRAESEKVIKVDNANLCDQFDTLMVKNMVEDHWKLFLLSGRQDIDTGAKVIAAFDQRIQAQATSMSASDGAAFKVSVEREREKLLLEYESSPSSLMQRLDIRVTVRPLSTFAPVRKGKSNSQGLGELVVRTAIRATIWEIIRSIFRR